MTRELCANCGGSGWTTDVEPAHDPECDGTCKNCPIPVQVQVECSRCQGNGYQEFAEEAG